MQQNQSLSRIEQRKKRESAVCNNLRVNSKNKTKIRQRQIVGENCYKSLKQRSCGGKLLKQLNSGFWGPNSKQRSCEYSVTRGSVGAGECCSSLVFWESVFYLLHLYMQLENVFKNGKTLSMKIKTMSISSKRISPNCADLSGMLIQLQSSRYNFGKQKRQSVP